MQLADAVVVVTGGTGGLGSRICLKFADQGARVAVVYLTRQSLAETLDRLYDHPAGMTRLAALGRRRVMERYTVDRMVRPGPDRHVRLLEPGADYPPL